MTEFTKIEPLWEIKRLMKIPPGYFRNYQERGPGMTAPIRHNENWIYYCPECNKHYESALFKKGYFLPCTECRE